MVAGRVGFASDIIFGFTASIEHGLTLLTTSDVVAAPFDATPVFEGTAFDQSILDNLFVVNSHDICPFVTVSDIISANPPFIIDNTGGAGTGSAGSGSGIDIYEEGVLAKAGATELNFIGAGMTATDAGGVRADATLNRVEVTQFTNVTSVAIPNVTQYPIFAVYDDDENLPALLFDQAMFNQAVFDQIEGIASTTVTWTISGIGATYDPVTDILTVTFSSTKTGRVVYVY